MLDNELEDELNDLKSTSTTAANTPVLAPRTPKHYLTDNIVSSPKKCENGICKIDYTNNSQNSVEPFDIETSNSSEFSLSSNETTDNIKPSSQSSPLRYISQEPKRGRPKNVKYF